MALKKRRYRTVFIILLFLIYFLLAARPVPREIVLSPKWISSLTNSALVGSNAISERVIGGTESASDENSPYIDNNKQDVKIFPYTLGAYFGYVDSSGQLAVNRTIQNNIYLGKDLWTEYAAEPSSIEIKNISEETVIRINNTNGYPVLLDDRIFILGSEQNSLSEIDRNGNIIWIYEFGAPLTCIDAAAGLVMTGSLDGLIEIFNSAGERIFYFPPGGSRYEVILGCAISRDGSRIGIISGIEQQRFLLLERFGNGRTDNKIDINNDTGGDYKVVYHEFLDDGFRRPVHILFIDEDRRIVFERSGGIGCYNIRTRRGIFIPLDGEIAAVEDSGEHGYFFIITSHEGIEKKFVGVKFPQDNWFSFVSQAGYTKTNSIFLQARFKSEDAYLNRTRLNGGRYSMLVAGGGTTLISYTLEEK
ncbi:MAG: WD40 repeat domain-containing protein [Treponema sp.]|nr:WD40 repeat domain-containing protein [Treponema sp.]